MSEYQPRNEQVAKLVWEAQKLIDRFCAEQMPGQAVFIGELRNQILWYAQLFDEDTEQMLIRINEIRGLKSKGAEAGPKG